MKIRFRADSVYRAMFPHAALGEGESPQPAQPVREPGDTWPVFNQRGERIAYAICCPKCGDIHLWAHADDCGSRRPLPGGGTTCDHEQAQTSCWMWTGSPEDGTLTARPSLLSKGEKGGCGWHGFLTNNDLAGA